MGLQSALGGEWWWGGGGGGGNLSPKFLKGGIRKKMSAWGDLKYGSPPGDKSLFYRQIGDKSKVIAKMAKQYFGVDVKVIENYRPFQVFRSYGQFSRQ